MITSSSYSDIKKYLTLYVHDHGSNLSNPFNKFFFNFFIHAHSSTMNVFNELKCSYDLSKYACALWQGEPPFFVNDIKK